MKQKTARQAADPGIDFQDPTAEGGYVPHRDNPMLAPERAYQTPFGVLHDDRLSLEEKRAVLSAWRDKEARLAAPPGDAATGMAGDTMAAIEESLERLG